MLTWWLPGCKKKKDIIFNFNTNSKNSCMLQGTIFKVCRSTCKSSRLSNSFFGNLKFSIDNKNNDFVEFKAHLIHRKHVPLLHNTEVILCYKRDGIVQPIPCLI